MPFFLVNVDTTKRVPPSVQLPNLGLTKTESTSTARLSILQGPVPVAFRDRQHAQEQIQKKQNKTSTYPASKGGLFGMILLVSGNGDGIRG